MKIDVSDGSIAFSSGTIGPQMHRAAFLSSPIGIASECILENAGYVQLQFQPEPGVQMNALFKDDRLDRLFVLMKMPSDDLNAWTEAHELERKAVHDRWLREELGKPPYDYPWGRIVSEYDAKGCESEIILLYRK